MERKKNKISGLIIFLLLVVFTTAAQQKNLDYYRCAFFESYRQGDMSPWPGLIAEMENAKSADLAWQTEMLKAMYGLVGYDLGRKDKDAAKIYIDKADRHFDELLEKYPRNARLHSLAGAFYGYKIAVSFYKAPFLGPKSLYHIDQAIELDPLEPMGYLEKANSLYYRPAMFGGSKTEGLACYEKALKLMDEQPEQKCDWQKLLLRAFILKSLYETNQPEKASQFKAEMQKDYGSVEWVKQFVGTTFLESK